MAVIEDHDGTPVLAHEVGGYRYSFCVSGFPSNKHEWLCGVISRHMNTIQERAVRDTEARIKENIRRALGVDK